MATDINILSMGWRVAISLAISISPFLWQMNAICSDYRSCSSPVAIFSPELLYLLMCLVIVLFNFMVVEPFTIDMYAFDLPSSTRSTRIIQTVPVYVATFAASGVGIFVDQKHEDMCIGLLLVVHHPLKYVLDIYCELQDGVSVPSMVYIHPFGKRQVTL